VAAQILLCECADNSWLALEFTTGHKVGEPQPDGQYVNCAARFASHSTQYVNNILIYKENIMFYVPEAHVGDARYRKPIKVDSN
jgi:hypothetical protein